MADIGQNKGDVWIGPTTGKRYRFVSKGHTGIVIQAHGEGPETWSPGSLKQLGYRAEAAKGGR